jgi:hypothetical protein
VWSRAGTRAEERFVRRYALSLEATMLRLSIAAVVTLLLVAADARGHGPAATQAPSAVHVRIYYIAADEVDWTYVPSGGDQAITGKKDDFAQNPASKGMLDPNQTTYRKAIFREYTDSTFRRLKPQPEAWTHLGILGPLLRAEVGDTIKVVFRNNAGVWPLWRRSIVWVRAGGCS